jgi:hypothetical protein
LRVFGLGMVGRLGKADSAAGIEASGTESSAAVAGGPGQIILGVISEPHKELVATLQ